MAEDKGTAKPRLIAADDDETLRGLLAHHAGRYGFDVTIVESGNAAMELIDDETDVLLLDLHMADGDGMDCLKFLAAKFPDTPAVMLSAADEIKDAVEAMKAGAVDFLTKPFDLDELFQVLRQAVEIGAMRKENRALKEVIGVSRPVTGIIGDSETTKEFLQQLEKIAALGSTVLLTGETGVGKGLAARAIHYGSTRAENPFVTVSCPALPRELLESELFGHEKGAFTGALQKRIGKIEAAAGGTLFLDEIGDLPLELQPKLLNVLQDLEFQRVGGTKVLSADVRVIAATNLDLKEEVQRGEFREDLFYRLNVIPLEIPALRERAEDIAALATHFLARGARGQGVVPPVLAKETLKVLEAYDWPGNVRQLENVLERAAAFLEGDTLMPANLPEEIRVPEGGGVNEGRAPQVASIPLRDLEKLALTQTLEATGGNKAEAARRLGITEKSIYNKLKRYHLA